MIHRTEDAAVGLTSLKLIILLGVVAFAAAAAAVYFWPKLSRQGCCRSWDGSASC